MAEKFIFEPWDISKLQSSYDVVIVGSGSTGLTAAIQAHELGLKPVVLEKMEKFGGNTNRASSGMNAAETTSNYIMELLIIWMTFIRKLIKVVES